MQERGVRRAYGYPGNGAEGLDVALETVKDSLTYIQVRHEEMPAFMASGRGHVRAGGWK